MAIALVDYVSQNKEELSFQRGDTIRDISTADADAPEASSQVDTWLRGELRGRTGLIRSSHVCLSSLPDGDEVGGVHPGERGFLC